jgi:hypothetical protein
MTQAAAIQPEYGKDGTELNEDLECLGPLINEIEPVPHDDQMSGRGHRNELRGPLHQAQYRGFPEQIRRHGRPSGENFAVERLIHRYDAVGGEVRSFGQRRCSHCRMPFRIPQQLHRTPAHSLD